VGILNVVLLGYPQVGKTTFVKALRNLARGFNPIETLPTISPEKYYVRIGNIEFRIIDTPGHSLLSEKDSKKILKIAKKARIVLFFVDVSRPITYSFELIYMISKYVKPEKTIVVVNKMDLVNYSDVKIIDVIDNLKKSDFTPVAIVPISAKTLYNVYRVLKVLANMLGYDLPIVIPIIAVRVMLNDTTIAEFTQKDMPRTLVEFLNKVTVSQSTGVALDLVSAFWSAVRRFLSSYDKAIGDNFMIDTLVGKIAIISKNIDNEELTGLFVLDKNLVSPLVAIKPKLEKFLINVFEYFKATKAYFLQLTENDLINLLMMS